MQKRRPLHGLTGTAMDRWRAFGALQLQRKRALAACLDLLAHAHSIWRARQTLTHWRQAAARSQAAENAAVALLREHQKEQLGRMFLLWGSYVAAIHAEQHSDAFSSPRSAKVNTRLTQCLSCAGTAAQSQTIGVAAADMQPMLQADQALVRRMAMLAGSAPIQTASGEDFVGLPASMGLVTQEVAAGKRDQYLR